ncbi:hypothetical protein MNBD_GAMMA16-253 [hydrothermal vent metagenome]|uniref:Methyltransferase FkbM domain-containing protein n=1 Tax=hydrothermal vent metagenome TaxID=652676 RepID=A0A3B0ZQ47_9ZZZZ
MLSKTEIKILLRSRSVQFLHDIKHASNSKIATYNWQGTLVSYRPGTSDAELIYKILLKTGKKAEYRVPEEIAPKVIFDIGANIGIATLYYAKQFPEATIHAFEPIPDNYALLRKNTQNHTNIKTYNYALGSYDGSLGMFASDSALNNGGFSFYETGSDINCKIQVNVKSVPSFLAEQNIQHIDLMKIDTEGAEYEIIHAMNPRTLQSMKWIIGELHGEKDFELLAYLSQWFDIDTRKKLQQRLFMFNACNKNFTLTQPYKSY